MSVARWSLATLLLLLTLVFLNSVGTGDVGIWLRWADRADTLGLASGFAANAGDYPPLMTVILLLAVRVGRWVGLDPFRSLKLTILVVHVASTLVVFRWTRSLIVAMAFHAAVLLNTVAQGYIDIFAVFPLLLSLWALSKRHLTWFAVLFTLASLIKWQPLMMAPFVAVHVIATTRRLGGAIDVGQIISRLLVPALAIVGITVLFFGAVPTVAALTRSLSHDALSANALNANWVVTHLLHVFDASVGGLEEGRANWIASPPEWSIVTARVAFTLAYGVTLWAYIHREKTFDHLLKFGLLGFLAHFMLNAGVHENHLLFAGVLAVLLAWLEPDELWPALVIVAMSNINMLLFGGLDGDELGFRRVFANRFDPALPLAVVNTVFFSWYWASEVFRPRAQTD